MDTNPRPKDTNKIGNKKIKINRQPRLFTTNPPNVGPTAGATAVIKDPTPIMEPILLAGTDSKIILNIKGKAIPVPKPCKTRPTNKSPKLGAQASNKTPLVNKRLALRNNFLVTNRFFNSADNGTIIATINK